MQHPLAQPTSEKCVIANVGNTTHSQEVYTQLAEENDSK